jgi:hypothetical protein
MVTDSINPAGLSTRKSVSMFHEAVFHGQFHRLWARLTKSCFCLRELDETAQSGCVEGRRYAGLQTVSIDQIKGTEGKADEFDAEFNPTQERSRSRWIGIAQLRIRGRELPPIELTELDGVYYVRDGHHRISVSRAMGQAFIEAEVTTMVLCRNTALR